MAIDLNQFSILPTKGTLTLFPNTNLVDCKVQSGTLAVGDPVEIVDVAGSVLQVKKATALTSKFLGCVPYSVKGNEYATESMVRIAMDYCCMQMEASAAVPAGAAVQIDPATGKVAPQSSTNTTIGEAFAKAAGDGDLIPVMIKIQTNA